MISHKLLKDEGLLLLKPQAPLEVNDFVELAREVDAYLDEKCALSGLLIEAKRFPGWHDFAAFLSHLEFVRGHHARIKKVSLVTDNKILTIFPRIASHFVDAEIRHFPYKEKHLALAWLREAE